VLPEPDRALTQDSQVVFRLYHWAEVTFADLRPQIDESSDWRIALFAFAKDRLHIVERSMVEASPRMTQRMWWLWEPHGVY
jgi:hypothetical protein